REPRDRAHLRLRAGRPAVALPRALPGVRVAARRGEVRPHPAVGRTRRAGVAVEAPRDEVDALAVVVVERREPAALPAGEFGVPGVVVPEFAGARGEV